MEIWKIDRDMLYGMWWRWTATRKESDWEGESTSGYIERFSNSRNLSAPVRMLEERIYRAISTIQNDAYNGKYVCCRRKQNTKKHTRTHINYKIKQCDDVCFVSNSEKSGCIAMIFGNNFQTHRERPEEMQRDRGRQVSNRYEMHLLWSQRYDSYHSNFERRGKIKEIIQLIWQDETFNIVNRDFSQKRKMLKMHFKINNNSADIGTE